MTSPMKKSFEQADIHHSFDRKRVDEINLEGKTLGRVTFEPGWKWSETKDSHGERCGMHHRGYMISGKLGFGTEEGKMEAEAGDLVEVPQNHDAWVVGDKPAVMLDMTEMS